MEGCTCRRVVLAVEPPLLSDTLTAALESAGHFEVVRADAVEAGVFDAAVVTVGLPEAIRADVVIELPHNDCYGQSVVRTPLTEHPIELTTVAELLDLIQSLPERLAAESDSLRH